MIIIILMIKKIMIFKKTKIFFCKFFVENTEKSFLFLPKIYSLKYTIIAN